MLRAIIFFRVDYDVTTCVITLKHVVISCQLRLKSRVAETNSKLTYGLDNVQNIFNPTSPLVYGKL